MKHDDRCTGCSQRLSNNDSTRYGAYCSLYCYNTNPKNIRQILQSKAANYGQEWRGEVEYILEQNRGLLQRLRQREVKKRWVWNDHGALQWLRSNGFNFEFHTQIRRCDDGSTEVHCFDEGYKINSKGLIQPIEPVESVGSVAAAD